MSLEYSGRDAALHRRPRSVLLTTLLCALGFVHDLAGQPSYQVARRDGRNDFMDLQFGSRSSGQRSHDSPK